MPSAVPARMYLRSFYFDTQAQRRRRVVALPLVLALVEPGSRYSLNDPRIEPSPPPPSRRSRPKPPASSSHRVERPRKFHVQRRSTIRSSNGYLATVSPRRSGDARGHKDDRDT